jgi:hypothetical protein
VVDAKPLSDLRRRVDLHSGAEFGILGDPAGKEKAFMPIKPMGQAVIEHRMEAVIKEKDFRFASRGGIPLFKSVKILPNLLKHNDDPPNKKASAAPRRRRRKIVVTRFHFAFIT